MGYLHGVVSVALDAAPWLVLGLLAAGLVHAFLPDARLRGWFAGNGGGSIARAALAGVPLPLCSCGAIPTALSLHRAGAGRGPTTAFLVSTPGVGVDSMAITYALLGPVMLVGRVFGAFATAVATGLLVGRVGGAAGAAASQAAEGDTGCCGTAAPDQDCCPSTKPDGKRTRLFRGVQYAFTQLLDDISVWLLVGLLVAGALMAALPPETLAAVGSGILPMLVMALIGVPMYICATAATPVAAGLLFAGVSPGTVLVFLLAGPVTSLATLGALRREMGTRSTLVYLAVVAGGAVVAGLLLDGMVASAGLEVAGRTAVHEALLPPWLQWLALAALLMLAIRPLRRLPGRLGITGLSDGEPGACGAGTDCGKATAEAGPRRQR